MILKAEAVKKGDFVSVIDEDLSGTITSVHGEMVVFKDDNGFTYQYPSEKLVLRDTSFYDQVDAVSKPEEKKPVSKKNLKKIMELDLHFESLVSNPLDYNGFERLFLQKEKLVETLDFCRKHKIKELRVIHGIGDGTLQKLVTDVLEGYANIEYHHTEILRAQSGAIMVEFL